MKYIFLIILIGFMDYGVCTLGRFNPALLKQTYQSSVYSEGSVLGNSAKAVDRKNGTSFENGDCTHTSPTVHTWWAVDLNDTYTVYSVKITDRNFHDERLVNFTIMGSYSHYDPNHVTRPKICKHQREALPSGKSTLIVCDQPLQVRISALKMKRTRMRLPCRRGETTHSQEDIRQAIQNLLPSLPWTAGYRNIHQSLKHLGYDVRRNTVQELMRELDPEGVLQRKRRCLRRRRYVSPGPNYTWHVDGYDKLKPYGFAIHGAIDGYSRRIMWLEENPSNNNPRFIATYYMACVQQVKGCPHILCTDPGTENGVIAAQQCSFREKDNDEFHGINSHIYVKSTSNQRIESWWCMLRRERMEWWIDYFSQLAASPDFNKDDHLDILCLRYTFMPLLKMELEDISIRWNSHYNTGNPYGKCPPGKPDILYSLGESYLHTLTDAEIQELLQECEGQTRSGSSDFDDYAMEIYTDMQWEDATTSEYAYYQYTYLRDIAKT